MVRDFVVPLVVAFILIYYSLMVGIGLAIALLLYLSKTWVYSAILAVTIMCYFVCFGLIGAMMIGEVTDVQISFILVEIIEVAVGLFLIIKASQKRAYCVMQIDQRLSLMNNSR